MANNKNFSQDLLSTLSKAVEDRIYGSVEVYFEDGKITQITQRTIKKLTQKVKEKTSAPSQSKKPLKADKSSLNILTAKSF